MSNTESFEADIRALGVQVLDGEADDDALARYLELAGVRWARIRTGTHRTSKCRIHTIRASSSVTFSRVSSPNDATVSIDRADGDSFFIAAPVQGSAYVRYATTEGALGGGRVALIPPYDKITSIARGGYDISFVAVDRHRVERVAARLVGSSFAQALHTKLPDDNVPPPPGLMPTLRASMTLASTAEESLAGALPDRLADLAVEILLLNLPSVLRRMNGKQAGSQRTLQGAMEFMSAHLAEPLTLADIAAAVHLSPRALQLTFQRHVGEPPMQWLRNQRLENADRLLRSPMHAHLRVSDIAVASGLLHMSEFAQRYRERFGLLPSERRRSVGL